MLDGSTDNDCGKVGRTGARWLWLVLLGWLAGCGGSEDVLRLPQWTLVGPTGERDSISLPAHYDERLPDEPSTYRLITRVDVPPTWRGETLTLAIPYLPALADLRVNGELRPPLDHGRLEDYRAVGPHRWNVPPELSDAEVLRLELEVEHRWTQAAWFDSVPRLSPTTRGDVAFLRARALNAVFGLTGLAAILLVCFSYGVIFLSARSRARPAGWFALEAAAGASYPAFVLGVTQPLFGVYDGAVMGAALVLATIGNVYFVHGYCNLGPPHPVWKWSVPVCALAYVVAPGPFEMTYGAAPASIALMLANCVYQTVIFVRLSCRAERPKLHEWVVPIAWPLAHAFAAADFAAWAGLGEIFGGIRAGALGIGIISLLQTLALSREYILSLSRSDRLNAELALRVELMKAKAREVEHLNDELRRQIEGRSAQLARALTRLAAAEPGRHELMTGDLVDDRYRVLERVGQGGMGSVYAVERISDGRKFALKLLSATSSRADMARFAREAQIISQLDHPNIVSIVDMDVSESGVFFLVMEYVEGLSLRHHRVWYREPRWALSIVHDVAVGLSAIHERGMVHRDLKPGNVLISRRPGTDLPRAKLGDFGISRIEEGVSLESDAPNSCELQLRPASAPPTGDFVTSSGTRAEAPVEGRVTADATRVMRVEGASPTVTRASDGALDHSSDLLTQTGVVIGTPHYIAPELIAQGSRNARPSSDMFSLGVIAYELLVGERPFEPSSGPGHVHGERRPELFERLPDLDFALCEALEACLSFDPADRPSARELVVSLDALSSARPQDEVSGTRAPAGLQG